MPCATETCPGEGLFKFPLDAQYARTVTVCPDCFAAMRARQVLEEARQRRLTPAEVELLLQEQVEAVRNEPPPIWAVAGL